MHIGNKHISMGNKEVPVSNKQAVSKKFLTLLATHYDMAEMEEHRLELVLTLKSNT